MNLFQLMSGLGFLGNVILGGLVFATNWSRAANRGFALMSVLLATWLASLCLGSAPKTAAALGYLIRFSDTTGLLIPLAFDILRHSIADGRHVLRGSGRRWIVWVVCMAPFMVLCWTKLHMVSASLPGPGQTVGLPNYGPAFAVYPVYYVVATGAFVRRFVRDLRNATGIRRVELQYLAMGCIAVLVYGMSIMAISSVTNSMEVRLLLPLAIIVFDGFVAYGIATRRISGVSHTLQRLAAYGTLIAYLVCLYGIVWFLAEHAIRLAGIPRRFPYGHLVATLLVAVSAVPAQGWAQRFAAHLFLRTATGALDEMMEKANRVLRLVTRMDALLDQFSSLIQSGLQATQVRILLPDDKGHFVQCCPRSQMADPPALAGDSSLVRCLRSRSEPMVLEIVTRTALAVHERDAVEFMGQLGVAMAVGVYAQTGLKGIVLVDSRASGRVYAAMEQRTVQLICNQLGIALENARLYTALQDAKIYNDLIVDSLVSGLVVTDMDGRITVMNRKAQEITGLPNGAAPGQPLTVLPAPVESLLRETIAQRAGAHNRELAVVCPGGDEVPLRASSAVFRGHDGKLRGALLLLNDMTELRKLEAQVRRTDRLSSLGTLSAGMAHEIKNPLVSIKTFAQLLPERYTDEEFRTTFFNLIGNEVSRIDSIVNRLLRFARPSPPSLVLLSLHRVIDDSLQLIQQQARGRGVETVRHFEADDDRVHGDGDMLKQAFLNFFLNAVEAMPSGGTLSVTTQPGSRHDASAWGVSHLRVIIHDTGQGIRTDDLQRIFDPFFTTKASGTGLGLSVAHGILQEHHVAIDVESRPETGTAFTLEFPLARQEVNA